MKNLFIKKDLNHLIADVDASEGKAGQKLERTLGVFNLTTLGIGAIIGAGIFSLTGAAAAHYAGPGIVYSFIIGGILCTFAGLCYAEMAAMVPVSGSAYAYSYATMGEVVAWFIGWNLILEYAFGAVTISASWSGYFVSLLSKTLGIHLNDTAMRFTRGPWEELLLSDGTLTHGLWNVPASAFALFIACVLYRGMRKSVVFNNVIVFIKITILTLFIVLGWSVIDPTNWFVNPDASGLSQFIPVERAVFRAGEWHNSFGWPGVLAGAGVVFFAFIGFDAVSTTAQECKNPRRDLPIGILTSLFICTLFYILMALVITGVVNYTELGVPDPIAVGIDRIVALREWPEWMQKSFTFVVKLGALAGLTSGALVLSLGQTRVLYAMGRDGLLPWFDRLHNKFATPHLATVGTGIFCFISAGIMPMNQVGELVSIGTLLAFVVVCAGIPILRFTNPQTPRPFKTPVYWLVAPAGALSCLWVMSGLPADTWMRLAVWLFIGACVYLSYGYRNSRLRKSRPTLPNVERKNSSQAFQRVALTEDI